MHNEGAAFLLLQRKSHLTLLTAHLGKQINQRELRAKDSGLLSVAGRQTCVSHVPERFMTQQSYVGIFELFFFFPRHLHLSTYPLGVFFKKSSVSGAETVGLRWNGMYF